MVDLWPQDITYVDIKPPSAVLEEQAALLGQKTKNLVTAQVVPDHSTGQGNFVYNFAIVAPTLGNYSYSLFRIEHDIQLYPVRVYLNSSIYNELYNEYVLPKEVHTSVDTEEGLLELLGKILRSKKTRSVIQALLAQITHVGVTTN